MERFPEDTDRGGGSADLRRTSFGRHVRNALSYLYDIPYLQSHPLASLLGLKDSAHPSLVGPALRQRLLEAIEHLRPESEAPTTERAGRRYELLKLRYASALDVPEICQRLGVSQSEYYREHAKGLEAIVADLMPRREPAGPGTGASITSVTTARNFPAQFTSFVGRQQEIDEVRNLLLRPDVRLLTLTGTGGVGKTRLGLQVVMEMPDVFHDGVFFVGLAPIRDPALVLFAIARSLGLEEQAAQSVSDALKDHLKDREVLLMLDNLEQVVLAAPFLSELLTACPRLKILVTSRTVLHLQEEWEFTVPSLAPPDLNLTPAEGGVELNPAVALFIERAQGARPGFAINSENAAAVAEICVRLDGLPLAIELAATRIKILSPAALLERLQPSLPLLTGGARDAPERQQTLRATLDWSYQLLEPAEQRLFQRLAVFVGGCSLEAIEAVCLASGETQVDILDALAALVDHSLVRQASGREQAPRFAMLETVREYAYEQLSRTAEREAVRQLHQAYYLHFAEEAQPELSGPRQAEWLDRLEQEHANFRAALEFCQRSNKIEEGLRLGAALAGLWVKRGHLSEGRKWLAMVVSLGAAARSEHQARALLGAGSLAMAQGDRPAAQQLFEQSLTLFREAGDDKGVAETLTALGGVPFQGGDYPRAHELLTQALELWRRLDNSRGIAATLHRIGDLARVRSDYGTARSLIGESLEIRRGLGDVQGMADALSDLALVCVAQGDETAASPLWDESLTLYRRLGDGRGIASTLGNLGRLAYRRGDYITAGNLLSESLTMRRELDDKRGIAFVLNLMGEVARRQGDYESAAARYHESLPIYRQLNFTGGVVMVLHNLGYVECARGQASHARALFEESLGWGVQIDNKLFVAIGLGGIASAAALDGELTRAARLFAASQALLDAIDAKLAPADQAETQRYLDRVRNALEQRVFETEWDAGMKMSLADAAAFATQSRGSLE